MSKENRVSDEKLDEVIGSMRECRAVLTIDVLSALEELQSLRSKPVAGVEVKDALEFYRVEAEAAAKAVPAKQTDAMAAIVTVMSLDGGRRAREAIAALSTLSLPAQEPVRRAGWRQRLEDLATEIEIGNATAAAAIVDELLEGLGDVEEMATIAPHPEAVITEEMVERAYEAFVAACEWSDWDEPEVRGYLRTALTAALKEA